MKTILFWDADQQPQSTFFVRILKEKVQESKQEQEECPSTRGYVDDEYDKEADQRLSRKISWALFPILMGVTVIQFIDKFALNYSAVLGLYEDVDLTGTQFSLSSAIFFIGLMVVQIPNIYLFQRLPIAKYFGTFTVFWGISVGCTALVTDYPQLLALRFLIGFFESTSLCSGYLLVSIFYRRHEQVFWLGVLMAANFIGMSTSGLFGYAIGYMDGLAGMRAWKWLMIIWGSITVLFGILLFVFLPDTPYSRWFRLSEQEKKLMDARLLENGTVVTHRINLDHIKESLRDPRYYCYILITMLFVLQVACSTTFSSQMIHSMGFSQLNSVLLNVPIGVATILLIYLAIFLNRYFQQFCFVIIIMLAITMTGLILMCVVPLGPAQMAGIILSNPAPCSVVIEACILNNISGFTKRTFFMTSFLIAYSMGNFIGPIMLLAREAPRYYSGLIGYLVADLIVCGLLLVVRYLNKRENKRRDTLQDQGQMPPKTENRQELDWTDGMDLHFRYRL
ncbi:major facilitator superfamily domain-containing protein [Zychaea mexicana]|uniref:major facilitator superfamily domain-containing protein n=1 Tax=Zychaea mexicana TaxID=64656 RepID=UPI0022FEC356|nr:major facilitator superfamily domain-containing protein [Zychaea mexicana]KAI9488689.1 major facilitator superfamily domain-containing protein [Zychaea mexicana]